jgi:site-specific DNA recombinase
MRDRKQAYGYLRVSGLGQVKGHGFDRQEEAIRTYAKTAKVEIVEIFREAHTGTEAERPVFVEMLDAILGNGVRTIIVESLDRLARDMAVQIALLGELRRRGVSLIAANTGEDVTATEDPMREAMVQIQGVFAQLDKRLLVRKLRTAREAMRAETGRCEGTKPFGSLPGEEAILDRILKLRRHGNPMQGSLLSFARIASTLNAEGVPSRTGKPWAPATVYGIVARVRPGLREAK